jgi:hypothetical protein
VGLALLLADSNAHPIGGRAILPGIENQIAVGLTTRVIQPPEDVIQFQRAGKFHISHPQNEPRQYR